MSKDGRLPSMPFYVADWFSSEIFMEKDHEYQAVYLNLCFWQWHKSEKAKKSVGVRVETRLVTLFETSSETLSKILSETFVKRGSAYFNPKVEEVFQQQQKWSKTGRKRGSKRGTSQTQTQRDFVSPPKPPGGREVEKRLEDEFRMSSEVSVSVVARLGTTAADLDAWCEFRDRYAKDHPQIHSPGGFMREQVSKFRRPEYCPLWYTADRSGDVMREKARAVLDDVERSKQEAASLDEIAATLKNRPWNEAKDPKSTKSNSVESGAN